MTDLQTRAEALRTALLDRNEVQLDKEAHAVLVATIHRADAEAVRLRGATAVLAAAIDAGLEPSSLSRNVADAARKARTGLRRNATRCEQTDIKPQDLMQIANGRSTQDALIAAGKLVDAMISRLERALDAERDRLAPNGLDQPLPEVPGHSARIVRLRGTQQLFQRDQRVDRDAVGRGEGDAVLRPLTALRDRAQQWSEDYPTVMKAVESESPQVRAFLTECASAEGAALSMATVEVLERLKRDGLLNEFRVRYR